MLDQADVDGFFRWAWMRVRTAMPDLPERGPTLTVCNSEEVVGEWEATLTATNLRAVGRGPDMFIAVERLVRSFG